MDHANVDFADLIARVKAHDQEAIAALLHRFEDDVRKMVRVRLPQALRGQFDSMDFVQAVWQSVLVHKGDDVGDFADVGKFRGFLATVARNKVFEEHRRRSSLKYDLAREQSLYVRKGDRDVPATSSRTTRPRARRSRPANGSASSPRGVPTTRSRSSSYASRGSPSRRSRLDWAATSVRSGGLLTEYADVGDR